MKLSTFLKAVILAFLAIAAFPAVSFAQSGAEVHIPFGPALPPVCNPLSNSSPVVFYLNTGQPGIYSCTAPNVWSQGTGGGGSGNATSIQGVAVSATPPSNAQCLVSNGTIWLPGSCSGSTSFGFNAITSGTNTTASMILSTGSSLSATSTALVDLSGITGPNLFKIPSIAGANPNVDSSFAFNSTSKTYVGSSNGSTVTFNTSNATVSSIAITLPSWLSVSPGSITTAGTFAITPTVGQTPHLVIGTCGAASSFAPCALVAGDIPTLNQSTTGTSSNVTGIVAVANGGTNVATLAAHGVLIGEGTSSVAVTGAGTAGQCFESNGAASDPSFQACASGFANPMTTLGDIIAENATPVPARVAGNTSTNMAGLTGTGNGTISALPVWTPYVGGGSNPVAATVSSVAQSQVLVYNGSGIIVNTYSGVSVDAQTGDYTLGCPTDRLGEIEFNITVAHTLTVPQAGSSACLGSNMAFVVRNTISSVAVLSVTLTTSTFQPEALATHTLLPGEALFVYSDANGSTGNYHAVRVPALYGGVNIQTVSYTATAADRNKLIIMNCSGACALTLPAAPPNASWTSGVESIGSTLATVSLNSLTYNASASVPALIKFIPLRFSSDGSNYFGDAPLVAGSNITLTPASNGVTIASSGGGSAFPVTVSGTVTSGGIPCFTSTTVEATSAALTANILVKGGGAGACVSNSLVTDNGTTLTYTGTGGVSAPSYTASGSTAGFLDLPQGSTSVAVTGCASATSICIQAPTSVTSYLITLAGTASTGIPHYANSSNVITETISLIAIADLSASGTPSSTTFLRGDNTWAVPAGGGGTPCTTTALSIQYNNAGAFGCVPDVTFSTAHTMLFGAAGILDLSATAPTAGLKLPSVAGAVPTADGFIGVNTTTHALVVGSNGTTIVEAAAATGTNTSTTCTNQVVTVISSVAVPTCTSLTTAFLPNIPLSQIISPTGAVGTFADGNNPLVFNSALTTASASAFTIGETTAATSTGTANLLNLLTLTGSTLIPLSLTQGAGASATNAPLAVSITGGAGGANGGATNPGKNGGGFTLTTGVGSNAGATSGTGGAGGAFNIAAGNGGTAAVASTTGAGGDIILTPGAAGGTGTAGRAGEVQFVFPSLLAANATPFVNITGTWNTTGVVDAALFMNITNTASGTGSLLADFQLSSVSIFKFDKAGNLTTGGANAGYLALGQGADQPNATTSILLEAPTSVTSYRVQLPGTAPTNTNSQMTFSNATPSVAAYSHAAQTIVLTGSAYTNATTSFSNLSSTTNLAFTLDASTAYAGSCYLIYSASAATAGPKLQFTGPASPTAVLYSSLFQLTATPTYADSVSATAFSTSQTAGTTVTNGANLSVRVNFGISNGVNAGTLQLQAASQGVGTVTIQPGSYCTMQ